MRVPRALSLLLFVLALHGGLAAAQPASVRRAITAEDYLLFETIADAAVSSDGTLVAYSVVTVDEKQNRRASTIWLVATDGRSAPRPFTAPPYSASQPRWSPDGRTLAFVSVRPATADQVERPARQVFLAPMTGGEPRRLTSLKNGVTSFSWSPDGSRLVCVGPIGPSDVSPERKSPSDVRHYTHSSYKFNGIGWFDDRRSHLWVVNVENGATKQLTDGEFDESDPQWSPAGTRIAFVSDRTGKALDGGRNTDIWVIGADGDTPVRVTDSPDADRGPRWSPDGRTIAYIGSISERNNPKIFIVPAGGGRPALAVRDLDLVPADLRWSDDGKAIYYQSGIKGATHIFAADPVAQTCVQVTRGDRMIKLFDPREKTRALIYVANDPTHLDDLYVSDLAGQNERRLTALNAALWARLELPPVERFVYKGADGWDVDGFFMKPVGWKEGTTSPMVLVIHGGPGSMFGFDFFHEFHVYAARGWAVLYTNPRGSSGYGERFERGVAGQWGGNAFTDIMSGVDAALKKYPWIDASRLGVTGGSYGGFMTNWIVSHTDRFKAAVTLRSISNFLSDQGTRDIGYGGHDTDFGGNIYTAFDAYWNTSPLKYAASVKTPTLILHSDSDHRVPLEQGEQWFRALKYFGVTTEFVIFPRENHDLTRNGEPKHLVESLHWQVYWFDRFLNGNTKAVPPDEARRPGA